MAEFDGQEKTEQPSSKKLDEARRKGMVAKSIEVNSLLIVVAGLITIFLLQSYIGQRMGTFTINIFNSLDTLPKKISLLPNLAFDWYMYFFSVLAPIMTAIVIVALASNIAQVGFKLSPEALTPKFSKLNPASGIKRIFSSKSLVEVFKTLLKFFVIAFFTYLILSDLIVASAYLDNLNPSELIIFMIDNAFSLLWKIALLYAVIAVIDFVYQRFKFRKDMMMTKQEVKEEMKQLEGDPHVKGRIRKAQMQAAQQRMMANLPTADVVITNPTHYAVALKYDMTKDSAPEVIAKGVDLLAQKIKKVAAEHNIPLHEDRELARALYKMCDVGDKIPPSLFKAVAQVLAYVYNLKKNKKY
ncbi:Flagellar biosynthetic protein FlhB [Ignavibacterium album JCM 16511]|uniref:Flagellar biosynthetic protein FlhB n=1 Tax=Ignavibacterium album (strain DSM 19864 / JCM 16511 / NBRC 101810 / Mat9-16) TaxID=945713 RepID=I0AMM2_IGNAJ|nr:flagellar biosynthesis protein FlhB [Ignavibacterium album]AFH50229.1 Flagellar biosynthetic protein FlhB [Ignavibacterium album JCM 16511]